MHIKKRAKALITRLRTVVVLGLLVSGLGLVAGTGVAAASTAPGHTIATAGTLTVGDGASGGGGPVDFWKVHLNGGARVLFTVPPTNSRAYGYDFELYTPGTNDANFSTAKSFSTGVTRGSSTTPTRFDLQAPYTGTFILAVCQGVTCTNTYIGGGVNPMNPYTFTTAFVNGGVSSAKAARETRAGASISAAKKLRLGRFEAGGANGVDFWKVHLNGGDRVLFTVPPTNYYGYGYEFDLYAPRTNDANFSTAQPLSAGYTNGSSTTPTRFNLRAPYTGTFILAACEGVTCTNAYIGGGIHPMNPYTFTTRQTGGRETRTSLRLSARTVTYRHEKRLRFYVAVRPVYGGHPHGKVVIKAGRKWLCTVRLAHGNRRGHCSPRSNTRLRPGKYRVTAFYRGNFRASKSRAVKLRVRK